MSRACKQTLDQAMNELKMDALDWGTGGAAPGAGTTATVPSTVQSTKPNSKESSITVSVRVRPFTTAESNNLISLENDLFFLGDGSLSNDRKESRYTYSPLGIRKIVDVVDDKMLIFDPPESNPITKMHRNAFPSTTPNSRIREHRFVFDQLFDVAASQTNVYESTTKPLLNSILDGFNATVFAYGATGCGKTHTILGTAEDPGVIFLTMKELYHMIDDLRDSKVIDISLSFLEIYNETIKDLLNPDTNCKKLVIREDSNQRISVSNLLSHKPNSVEEVMELILTGNKNRTCSPTEANSTSSRSHAVLQINVNQKNKSVDLTESHTFATLSIIDLAGSERAAATKNRGVRLNEGANINKSLLALGNCINALCDPRKRNHIPYRDSKLTRLLKFSLGGNCKTVMIVCISPLSQHYDETLNTLKYADRAKQIKTKIVRNQHNLDRHVGSYLKMITQQKQEIDELKLKQDSINKSALEKQLLLFDKCCNLILEHINNLKSSIVNKNQDKWKKYFLLAKRKVLLIQKFDFNSLFESLSAANNTNNNLIMNLVEQLISKVSLQIKDLETQYNQSNEIDYILTDRSQHTLMKLKEQEAWGNYHTIIFESYINSLRDFLEKDILFNSSILFDHLITELNNYNFFSKNFINLFNHYVMDKENVNDEQAIFNELVSSIEFLLNGDFDAILEEKASLFMQKKLREIDQLSSASSESQYPIKRGSGSPLKVSPPRTNKRFIKRPQKISPVKLRNSKKVHFEGTLDSDISNEESFLVKSDLDDDSPLQNSVLDKLDDDLDIKFDPHLNSPPISKTYDLKKPLKPRRVSSLTNKKLDDSKLPLLNKQALKLVSNEWEPPHNFNVDTPSHLMQFNYNNGTRNIESTGSEPVE